VLFFRLVVPASIVSLYFYLFSKQINDDEVTVTIGSDKTAFNFNFLS